VTEKEVIRGRVQIGYTLPRHGRHPGPYRFTAFHPEASGSDPVKAGGVGGWKYQEVAGSSPAGRAHPPNLLAFRAFVIDRSRPGTHRIRTDVLEEWSTAGGGAHAMCI